MFRSTGPHYCPVCPPEMSKNGKRRMNQPLTLRCSNYSGCGVDIAYCETCDRTFQISYKVDEILDVTEDVKKLQQ